MQISFILNEKAVTLEMPASRTLLDVLRYDLHMTGTKCGCGAGECGTCTVLFNGKAVNACLFLAPDVDGQNVVTIEGLEKEGELHPLQKAFIAKGAIQCGYCTPGMILSAKALLDRNPNPTREEIKEGLSGNLCRCTGYDKIFLAVESVVKGETLRWDDSQWVAE